jgi:hypothetical protein
MSRFKDLSKDKITVMMRLLSSQGICKALHYAEKDFLDKSDLTDNDKINLLYNKIFPYRKVPDINQTASTFITLSFRDYNLVNTSFKSGYIYINVLTHVDLIETDHGFLRYDFILSEIDELMNQQLGIGIGKPQFYKMDEIYVNEKYMGMFVAYKLYEFN